MGVLVLIRWRSAVVVEPQTQLAHLLEDLNPVVMVEAVQETVKMVFRLQGLEQVECLEMAVTALEPILYLEAEVGVEVHQRAVSQEELDEELLEEEDKAALVVPEAREEY